jgi:hypothetical protein
MCSLIFVFAIVQVFGEAAPELLALMAATGDHDPHELDRYSYAELLAFYEQLAGTDLPGNACTSYGSDVGANALLFNLTRLDMDVVSYVLGHVPADAVRITIEPRAPRAFASSSIIVHAGGLVVLMSMFGGLALAGALPEQGSGEDESGVVEIQDVETVGPPSWVGGFVGPLISVTVSVPQWA